MFTHTIRIGFTLILVSVTIFENVQARHYVNPDIYGYTVRLPQDGSVIAASESRTSPVIVELVNNPASQPIVVAPISAESDILVSDASAKVEKILRRPMSFSYNPDQDHQASSQSVKSSHTHKSQAIDQQPDAIDYYKYLARLENEEKGGAGQQKDTKQNSHAKSTKGHSDYSAAKPVGFHKHEDKHESKADVALETQPSEVKEDHTEHTDKDDDNHESSSNAEHKHEEEDVQTSASEHKGDKGGNESYKKGGGKHRHTEHHDIHDKKGEKVHDGKHHDERGDIGKHIKHGEDDHFTESGGHKKADHEEHEYHAEHDHGEEGKKGADFHEEGEHSKGHSTSGEHNIHKKDEFEKKQEFYDESHEGGDQEKHGGYFHEDDYHKGGHESSEHQDGADHKDHYGREKHYEHGGHHLEDVGHDKSDGHDKHHKHHEKGGKEVEQHGKKSYGYEHGHEKGDGGKGKGDSEGHGSKIQEVASTGKAGDAEAHGSSNHDQTRGASYATRERYSKGENHGTGSHAGQGVSQGSHSAGHRHGSQAGQVAEQRSNDGKSSTQLGQESKQLGDIYGREEGKNRYMLVIVDDANTANGQPLQESNRQPIK